MSWFAKLRASSYPRLAIGIALSVLFLYVAVRNIDMRDVRSALANANVFFILLALLSVAANTVAKAVRWKVLMGEAGRQVALTRLLAGLLVGQMLNTLLPVRVGDVSRAYTIGRGGPGRTFMLGTVALEKLFDMVAYAGLFVLLLLVMPLPTWLDRSVAAVIAVAILALVLVAALTYFQGGIRTRLEQHAARLPERMRAKTIGRLKSGLRSLEIMRSRSDVARLSLWSSVIWATALLNNYLVVRALDLHVPLAASLLVLIVLQAGIAIPSVPGRIGLFEYLCVLSLAVFGVGQVTAFSYGVLLHGIVMIPPTLVGLLLVWRLGSSAQESPPLPVVSHERGYVSER